MAGDDDSGGAAGTDDAVRALRLALHAARITLPGLRADGCSCKPPTTDPAHVALGSVPAEVALALAELISEGALTRRATAM